MGVMKPYTYNTGDNIVDDRRSLTVIDRKVISGHEYGKNFNAKTYTLRCNKCGAIFDIREEYLVRMNHGCICGSTNSSPIVGYNDINTLRPDLVSYFINKDDAKKYKVNSTKRIDFKCIECGYIKNIRILTLSNNGFSCPVCSDGLTYPNKFAYALFDQIGVPYIKEYSSEWTKSRRYDIEFEHLNNKYVVELDGGWHYRDNDLSGMRLSETLEIDRLKDELAGQNGYVMIRIDCRKSEREYIKANILSSILPELFDLSNIDWTKCDVSASRSVMKDICEYYENNDKPEILELCKHFGLSHNTISKYLNIGANAGICSFVKKTDMAVIHFNKAIQLYNENPKISVKELAKLVGVNPDLTRQYLFKGTELGLCNYIDRKTKIKIMENAIVKIKKKNPKFGPRRIAKEAGYPYSTVNRIYRRLGYAD